MSLVTPPNSNGWIIPLRLKLANKDVNRGTGVTCQKVGDGSCRLEGVVGLEGERGVEPWSPEDQLSRPSARLRQKPTFLHMLQKPEFHADFKSDEIIDKSYTQKSDLPQTFSKW